MQITVYRLLRHRKESIPNEKIRYLRLCAKGKNMKNNNFNKTLCITTINSVILFNTIQAQIMSRYSSTNDSHYKIIGATTPEFSDENIHTSTQARAPKQIDEAELLQNLDKDGRSLYRSLDEKGKKRVRSLAAKSTNYKEIIQMVIKEEADNKMKTQEKMLHNGMDRFRAKGS